MMAAGNGCPGSGLCGGFFLCLDGAVTRSSFIEALLDQQHVYEHLKVLLERLGIAVRCESFDRHLFGDLSARGGMCMLNGKRVVMIDEGAPLAERVAVLAQAAGGFDLDGVYLPPQVRDLVESTGLRADRSSHPTVRKANPNAAARESEDEGRRGR